MKKKDFLLYQMIKQYVKCQEPIGSESLKISLGGNISSATIRNYFKILGQEGVIMQTHISSGRIPTHLALRNYWRDQLNPTQLHPNIDSKRLKHLCNEFELTCALKPMRSQKLMQVIEVDKRVIVLVFEQDCVAIPFVANMARFCQELVGVTIDDVQKIAQSVCANSLNIALSAFSDAQKVQFFGFSFLGSFVQECPNTALSLINGHIFQLLDNVVFFPESSQYMIIAHNAMYQNTDAKMLCIGRLNQDYEGFYEALDHAS